MPHQPTRIGVHFTLRAAAVISLLAASFGASANADNDEAIKPNPYSSETMQEPYKLSADIDKAADGSAGNFAKELARAMMSISSGLGEPPLIELPGKLIALSHQGAPAPEWTKRQEVDTGQLYCVTLLKRHGLAMMEELGANFELEKKEKKGTLTEEDFRQFIGQHVLQAGYYSYGHVVQETLGHYHKNPVTPSQLEAAQLKVPAPADDEAYAKDLAYCASLSVNIANAVLVNQRYERLANGRFQMDKDLETIAKEKAGAAQK